MANEKDPLKIVTSSHRLSYVHIQEPTAFEENGKKAYDVTLLIPKDHSDAERIRAAVERAYKENKESLFKGIPMTSKNFWNPLRDGEEWLEEHPEATAYAGCYFVKAKSFTQPGCFDRDKKEILDLSEIYSGCWGRAVIRAYAFNNKSKGVGFFLNTLMKTSDDEPFGTGGSSNPDEFDEYEDESENDFI